jgi:hypothetical protein
MDKIKKALGVGDPVYKHDDDFDATIQRMRIAQEQEMKRMEYDYQRQMNAAQERYGYGWNDPRAMMDRRAIPSRVPSVEELYENVKRANSLSKDLMHKIERTEKKVEMLSGFYTWITEVYPEIAAQHKAMRDLYEAANSGETQPEKEA